MNNTSTPQEPPPGSVGSLDGTGSADHDMPYEFGRRPRVIAPFPFTTREYARLVVLRGLVQDRLAAGERIDDLSADGTGWRSAAA